MLDELVKLEKEAYVIVRKAWSLAWNNVEPANGGDRVVWDEAWEVYSAVEKIAHLVSDVVRDIIKRK